MKEFFDNILNYLQNGGVLLAKNITTIILIFLVLKIANAFAKKSIAKSKIQEKTIPNFILSLIDIALIVVLIFYALQLLFNVPATSFVAVASVFTLGISLALQDTIASFANGVLILLNKPFVEGEYILVNGIEGNVVSITMFSTVLKTFDGLMITIPNSQANNNSVKNFSRLPTRRVDLTVPVGYDSDVNKVKKVLLDVVSKQKGVITDPEPTCRLVNYGDSNLDFSLRVWVTADLYWDTRFDLQENVLEALRKNKISIDYNHFDLSIKSLPRQRARKGESK